MTTIILDRQSIQRLHVSSDRAEVRDESGELYGYYEPVKPPSTKYRSPYSEEDLDRFAAEPGGRSLQEILADLRSLP